MFSPYTSPARKPPTPRQPLAHTLTRHPRGLLLLAATCLWLALGLLARSHVAEGQADVATIDLADVEPGMRGYGLTVFRGTRPKRFEVEVIDVMPNFRPGQALILIKTTHPILEQAKIVAGMSGSPVYLDGKLAGAYAYGWTFGNDPIAGVTPIRHMLEELARPLDPEIWQILGTFPGQTQALRQRASRVAHGRAGLPPFLGERDSDALWALRQSVSGSAEDGLSLVRNGGREMPQLSPVATPLMLGGFGSAATDLLQTALAPHGLLPLQVGGGGAQAAGTGRRDGFVNGGAIGVQLARGDVSATAVGTVTHVAGRKLVAFGHPMMNLGQTALPTSTAKVVHVMSSLRRSFKMAHPITPLGAMVHDRQSAIVVDADVKAETVPLRLRLRGVPGAPQSEWNVEVASGRGLTPSLSFATLLNALQATAAGDSDVVYKATGAVTIPGHGTHRFVDRGHLASGAAGPQTLSRLRVFGAMEAAYGNPFKRARVSRVEIDLDLEPSDDVAIIRDVAVAHQEVDPGSTVDVYVTLQRFNGPTWVQPIAVRVPRSAAGAKVDLTVASGAKVSIPRAKPHSLEDLLEGLQQVYQPTSMVASLSLPTRGVRVRGHVAERLPASAMNVLLGRAGADAPVAFGDSIRTEIPMKRVIYGQAKLKLHVREEAL